MSKLFFLIKGEFIRLFKYKILIVAVAVSFIWCIIIGFTDANTAITLVPTLLFADAGMMSIILLAASYYLEKQEGTLKTLFVAPVKLRDILIAKVVASFVLGFISMVLVILTMMIVHQVTLPGLEIFGVLILIIVSHTAIGFCFIIYCRDFGTLVVYYGLAALLFILPTMFYSFGIIPESFRYVLMVSPAHAGQVMLSNMVSPISTLEWVLAIVYLVIVPILLYPLVIIKRIKQDAIGG